MSEMPDTRFELRRVTEKEWLILDHRYAENDPRRTVGCIYELEPNEVEAMWIREIPMAERYMSAIDALDDVQRFYENNRATRPITIPHLPPLLSP